MFEVKIHVPVVANSGKTFSKRHHVAFESELLRLFNGFTLDPLPYKGGWKDSSGKVYVEESYVYSVFIPSLVRNAVGDAVDFAKAHYAQFEIAIRYLGLAETL